MRRGKTVESVLRHGALFDCLGTDRAKRLVLQPVLEAVEMQHMLGVKAEILARRAVGALPGRCDRLGALGL